MLTRALHRVFTLGVTVAATGCDGEVRTPTGATRYELVPCAANPDCESQPFGIDLEMSWNGENRPHDLQLIQDSGTGWVRLVLFWSGFEPNPPTGEPQPEVMGRKSGDHVYDWNWAGFEDLVDQLSAQGKEIIFTHLFNPAWSNGAPPDCKAFHDDACGNVPTNMLWYEDYIYNLVMHFKDRVRYYSMLNEPNLRIFYNPTRPYAAGNIFAQFITDYAWSFDRALRAADPTALSFGPELSRNDAEFRWKDWWSTLVGYFPQYYDVLAQHYYEHDSAATKGKIDREIQPFLMAHGLFGRKPFWVTELGYDSCKGDGYQRAELQGSHVDMFNRSGFWKRIFVNGLGDLDGVACGHGLVHSSTYRAAPGAAKPAYVRYQQMTGAR
jgi:hypothetical protein